MKKNASRFSPIGVLFHWDFFHSPFYPCIAIYDGFAGEKWDKGTVLLSHILPVVAATGLLKSYVPRRSEQKMGQENRPLVP